MPFINERFIPLTVESVDNRNVAAPYVSVFDMARMSGLQANLNPVGTQTITNSNGTSKILLASSVFNNLLDGIYTYAITINGTTATFTLYNNAAMTNVVAQGSFTWSGTFATATIPVHVFDDYLITATVAVTGVGNAIVAETGALTVSTTEASTPLQINGGSQFEYKENVERLTKYTVNETISNIIAMLNVPIS